MAARAARLGAGTTQESVRRHNLGTLLTYLHLQGQLSRAELTTRLGLNRSTIAALVGELVRLGAAVEAAPTGSQRRSGAGRPSLDVRPSGAQAFVVAIDLGVEQLQAARIGLGGQMLQRLAVPTPSARRPGAVATAVAKAVRQLVADASPGAVFLGIGMGVPGIVREADGVVRFAPNLDWQDVPVARLIRQRLAVPCPMTIANDAQLGVLAEHTRGLAVGRQNVVFLIGDVGLGGGVIIDGNLLRGTGGYAGELGHLRVNSRGRLCRCGSVGCWETEVCAEAIARALQRTDPDIELLERTLRQLRRPSSRLRAVGRFLGVGLADVVNVLNPEVIVLGGLLGALFPVVQANALAAMAEGSLAAPREQTQVVASKLGRDVVLVGAAERAFEAVLADPARVLTEQVSLT